MQDECRASAEMADSITLKVAYGLKLITCILAIASVCRYFIVQRIQWLANANCRTVFNFHLACNIIASFFQGLYYVVEIYRTSQNHEDECGYTILTETSIHLRLPYVMAMTSQVFSMFVICIERAISTVFPNKYETITKPYLAYFLISLAIVCSVSASYLLLLVGITIENIPVSHISINIKPVDNRHQILLNIVLCVQLISIIIFIISLLRTYLDERNFKKKIVNLGNKYQVGENKLVINRLLPICCLHFIILVIHIVALKLYITTYPNSSVKSYAIFQEVISQAAIYSILTPLVIERQIEKRKKHPITNYYLKQEEYFKDLRLYFDVTPNRRK